MKLREPIFEAQINKLAEALENPASVHGRRNMEGFRWDEIFLVCNQYLSLDLAEYVPGEDWAEDHGRQVGTYSTGMGVQP